jgi:hypothetical protein
MVEMSKLPPEKQEQAIADLTARAAGLPTVPRRLVLTNRGELIAMRTARIWCFRTAQTRCVIAMLAVERSRRRNGRWPQSLDVLVPAQLQVVPLDPYDGKPLRYRPLADGVLIYAIGPDRKDDGGRFASNEPKALSWLYKPSDWEGWDIGVRLWDVEHRRRLPKEAAP